MIPVIDLPDAGTLSDDALAAREWLVTNGLGGFASGTVLGPPTRKYHGLLVPNLVEPAGRHVVLSLLDERLGVGDGPAVALGGAPEEAAPRPAAAPRLLAFALDGSIPRWTWRAGDLTVTREILMPHGRNLVCVRYRVDGKTATPATFTLRPFVALRPHEQQPDEGARDRAAFRALLERGEPCIEVGLRDSPLTLRLRTLGAAATFVVEERQRALRYPLEHERGYHAHGADYSPGAFQVALRPGEHCTFVASTEPVDFEHLDVDSLFEAERRRVQDLLRHAGEPDDLLAARLVLAADQFIVRPGSRADETFLADSAGRRATTVIAGYHWFGDWGRDTMISLEGLTLCTGRFAEAEDILRTFVGYVRDGLIPNLFPEGAREGLYHTVDATLWLFHALNRFVARAGEHGLVGELMPVLESICRHYLEGTRYGIGVDPADGLVRAGAPGYQLTWMDAKAGDWVVTPRRGKPVEIQALWYNALSCMAAWRGRLGLPTADYEAAALRCRTAFNRRFWLESAGHLFDVVDGEHGDDASGRPNQVFALSLDHPILDSARWDTVLDYLRRELLTPYGLRTLSPSHPEYRQNYHGDLLTRDGAYHQGTVWPWLIGAMLDAERAAARRVGGAAPTGRLASFATHLTAFGVGSIAEIFDAEPPFHPRGCIAQAWSVAEVLRARLAELADRGGTARAGE